MSGKSRVNVQSKSRLQAEALKRDRDTDVEPAAPEVFNGLSRFGIKVYGKSKPFSCYTTTNCLSTKYNHTRGKNLDFWTCNTEMGFFRSIETGEAPKTHYGTG